MIYVVNLLLLAVLSQAFSFPWLLYCPAFSSPLLSVAAVRTGNIPALWMNGCDLTPVHLWSDVPSSYRGLSTLRSLRGTWTHNRYLDGSCSSKLTQSSQRLNAASNSTACPETCFLWKVIWRSSGYIPCLIHWLRAESVSLERAPDKYLGFLKKYEKVCNVPQLIKGNDKGSSVIQT